MVLDEEEQRPRPSKAAARDLRTLSIADLENYVAELKAEIERVQGEIAKRRDVRGAADALFRKPADAPDR
jgi:uncharacterized small protein (DUF1192 family)